MTCKRENLNSSKPSHRFGLCKMILTDQVHKFGNDNSSELDQGYNAILLYLELTSDNQKSNSNQSSDDKRSLPYISHLSLFVAISWIRKSSSTARHKGQLLTVTALSRCGRSAEMSAISEISIITQIRAIRATSGQHDNHLLAGILANLLSLSQRERQYQQ